VHDNPSHTAPVLQLAMENMDVFKDAWEKHVRLLTEAVDEITTIDDFLAVSGKHYWCNLLQHFDSVPHQYSTSTRLQYFTLVCYVNIISIVVLNL
jgi:hypothetical protein